MTQIKVDANVRVKLTPVGFEFFDSFFGCLSDAWQQPRSTFPILGESEDGYYVMPFWQFVSVFGGNGVRQGEDLQVCYEGDLEVVE